MNINKLETGMVIKNYKVLCELVGWSIASGNTKISQMNELSMFCEWNKEGNKIIISKIFDDYKDKSNRIIKNNNWREYEQFKISYKDRNNIGIYCILDDNDIYIGSTLVGFRQRFREHYSGYDEYMQHTYNLLHNGATFNILLDMTGIEDEPLLRQVEDEFIQYAINNTNYNVINKVENTWSYTEKQEIIKYKTIKLKVQEDKYEEVMRLLIDNELIEPCKDNSNNYMLDGIEFDVNNVPF